MWMIFSSPETPDYLLVHNLNDLVKFSHKILGIQVNVILGISSCILTKEEFSPSFGISINLLFYRQFRVINLLISFTYITIPKVITCFNCAKLYTLP